jgi:hypothetical protein
VNEDEREQNQHIKIEQGMEVLICGILGILIAFVPTLLLVYHLPRPFVYLSILLAGLWACLVGLPLTYWWSEAIHKRLDCWRNKLILQKILEEADKPYPGRSPWMPAWLGFFERGFYSILIGLDVGGGAAFVGVWIALKMAGGWQVRSKGTGYGHAIFVAGLLGNLMSLHYGLVAGLVIRALIIHCPK